jgi:hypothetical protein
VVFFAFLGFDALEGYLEKPAWPSAVLYSIAAVLGFAAHLVFLGFFCAAVLWSGWRLCRAGPGLKPAIKSMFACHAAPGAFFAALYCVDIRRMVTGGANEASLPATYASSFGWALGAPPGRFLMLATILLAAALFLAGLWLLFRQKSDSWILFAGVILVFPILFAVLRNSTVIYVRYFIVGMAFFLLLLSFVLAALYQSGWRGRLLCLLLLAGYLAANGWHTISLFQHGRGEYGEAVRYMVENTKGGVVTIGSDNDNRNPFVLQFYFPQAMGSKTAKYYPGDSWPAGGPEWYLCHKESFLEPAPPGIQFTDTAGHVFEFVKAFQSAPLSGFHWFLYHNSRPS